VNPGRQHDEERTDERHSKAENGGKREDLGWTEVVREKKFGRLAQEIEEWLSYRNTGKRGNVKRS
jgi:hypothetical protein